MLAKKLPFQVLPFKPTTASRLRGAAIIVLQEWWGVNDQIKLHAQHLADLTGSYTVVPDLYKGKVGLNAEEAGHLMQSLNWKKAVDELEVLTQHLREAKYPKIGSIGFCMGGGLSLALASRMAETRHPLKAAVTCYGSPPSELLDHRAVSQVTAIQGHFGGKDGNMGFSDPATADALEFNLKINNLCKVEVFRYPEQGHAFMNDEDWSIRQRKELGFVDKNIDPKSAELKVRELAWERISQFFTDALSD
ncbi:dienelactone hydrolase [Dichotomocladium elegans]|nr:dienelactone hydrolase [Dichotomocladium elegans]